jgi:anti-sigma-K factor RskA
MATASPDHRERSWNRIVAGSREESAPAIEVRSVLRKELARITAAERPEVSCLLDMVATWRIPSALAAAVAVLAGVSIFVLRDAPSFLADPILYLLTNR